MKYVVGFLHDGKNVVLVKKNRPKWQKGKLNGPGGKIELNESAEAAMTREFLEETGLRINNWHWYAYLNFNGHDTGTEDGIFFFEKRVPTGMLLRAKTMESEKIAVYNASKLRKKSLISNLTWLLPLAMLDQKYTVITIAEIPS